MFNIKIPLALACASMLFVCTTQAQQDTTFESALDLSIEQLMNTKVSIATKSNQKLSEAPAVVTVITEEVIRNSGARNLTDILKDIPGFEFSKPRSGLYMVGIRGVKDILTTSKVLILKDGVPFNDIMYGMGIGLYKQFDVNSIERIEVIRGPGSALYGRNAFSGVINIITKTIKNKNQINTYASAGSYSTLDFGASYGTKIKDFDAFISFNKTKSDITDSKLDNGTGGESVWNLGVDNLYLNSKIRYKNFEFIGMYTDIFNGASMGPFNTESDKSTKIGIYSLSYNNKLSNALSFNAKIYGRNENQVQNLEIFKPGITAEIAPDLTYSFFYPNGMYATPSFNSYVYGVDMNTVTNFTLFGSHQTMFGFQGDVYGLDNVELYSSYDTYVPPPLNALTYIDNGIEVHRGREDQKFEERGWIEGNGHDYTNFALYLQHVFYPIKQLSLTIGGRYDYDSEIGGVFNPRLAGVFSVKKDLIFKIMYGQAYRAPNAQEQYRLTGFTLGNKNLKPETIKTTEFSAEYSINKKINNRLTFFNNTLSDIISAYGSSYGATKNDQYRNIGTNTSTGIEYEYKMMISKPFYMFLNYSYTLSTNEVVKNDTAETFMHRDISPHKLNLGLNYRFSNKVNVYSGINYRSAKEKYFVLDNNGSYVIDDFGTKQVVSQDKVGDYFLWNAKIRFMNVIKGFELSIEAYNILNTKYYDQDNTNAHQPSREGTQLIISLIYNLNQ